MAALPADIGVPVLVVQHMPSMFTKMLAERLDGRSALAVSEATNGQTLVPGHVYLAPGDWHMRVVRRTNDVVIQLDQGPLVNSCRPSVDVLLESVKTVYGANVLVAIMTGMGSDGADSAALLHQAGAQVIAQDEATSVVWGMPGAIVNRGLADAVVPLDQLASEIVERVGRREDKQPVPSSTPAHLPTHRGAK
jgi:two-component system chemotaxis response regulator CheB